MPLRLIASKFTNRSFLIRALSAAVVSNASVFVLQIVRSKVAALLTGTSGVGLWGATQSLSNSLLSFSTLGVTAGFPILVAESWEPENKSITVKKLAALLFLVFGFSSLIGIILVPFSGTIAEYALGDVTHWWLVVLALFANPFLACGLVIASALQGMAFLRTQTLLWILGHGGLTVLCIAGTLLYGAIGLSTAWLLYGFVSSGLAFYLLSRAIGKGAFCELVAGILRPTREMLTASALSIFPFARSSAFLTVLMSLSNLSVRMIVLNRAGLSELGLFASVAGVSGTVTALVQTIVSTYAIPQLTSSKKADRGHLAETNKLLNVVFLLSFPAITIVSLFAPEALTALFSSEFTSATDLARLYFVGELLQLLSWNLVMFFNVSKLPGRVSVAKGIEYLIFLLLAAVLFSNTGILGLGIAYVAAGLVGFATLLILASKRVASIFRLSDVLVWLIGFLSLIAIQQGLLWVGVLLSGTAVAICLIGFYRSYRQNAPEVELG